MQKFFTCQRYCRLTYNKHSYINAGKEAVEITADHPERSGAAHPSRQPADRYGDFEMTNTSNAVLGTVLAILASAFGFALTLI